ncbi:MAG TPA: ribosome biogenesis GTPase Der [Elusimicrobiota bacterium]|nr:ribosome biogenesis GTPase Der [Elusimicrobiota bacterium]
MEKQPALPRATVVLVGRPNVGKSTLFNRLCRKRRALTSPIPGTTRDWIEGAVLWGGRPFRVVDTGGYAPGDDDILASVRVKVEELVRAAQVAVWVLDGQEGLTPADRAVGRWLRRHAAHVLVAVNKLDDQKKNIHSSEFFSLGFQKVIPLSASHGRNINQLLDEIVPFLPEKDDRPSAAPDRGRFAIVGRPNVGKSSLLNRLLGEERAIVSNQPGTTRDTLDTALDWNGKKFLFMDTAGLRAKKSRAVGLEGLTRLMTEKALEDCQAALLLLDAPDGILEGDAAIARLIHEKNRACVVAVNKWDAVAEKNRAAAWFKERLAGDMPFLGFAPLLFVSAKEGTNVPHLMEQLWAARTEFLRSYDKDELESFFWTEIQNRPYSHHGKKLVFRGAEQVADAPPTFVLHTSLSDEDIHFSYLRHLENVFRRRFQALGTPLLFRFRR